MTMKNVLGRGVEALLPEADQEEEVRYFMCDVDKIRPNPHQPRSFFDEDKLQQLADSINAKGVIQPLLVTRDKGQRYTLIAGERRLRAAKLAGCDEVPVVLMNETNDRDNLELALIENIQRHDLNPIEEAHAYLRLVEEFQLTQEEVAQKVGRQRSTVTNILRLLSLPQGIQDDVVQARMTEGHARVLLRVKDDPEKLQEIRRRILSEALSVRATESLCRSRGKKAAPDEGEAQKCTVPPDARNGELSPNYSAALVNQLTNHFNTKVRLVQQGSRGKIEMEYYSSDDLDRLLNLLCGKS